MVPPLTGQDRHAFAVAIDFMLIEFTESRCVRDSLSEMCNRGRALTELFARYASTTSGICAVVTIDCVGSAGVHRAISELIVYVDRVGLHAD